MLSLLSRYVRGRSASGADEGGAGESRVPFLASSHPADAGAPRDLLVDADVATSLRDVFTLERARQPTARFVTVFDPEHLASGHLLSAVPPPGAGPIEQVRLIDANLRQPFATVDRMSSHSVDGMALRLMAVDVSGNDSAAMAVPLTMLEQSDVGIVLVGATPDPSLLDDIAQAMTSPEWRCAAIVFAAPPGAGGAADAIRSRGWPVTVFVDEVADPIAEMPEVWEAALQQITPGAAMATPGPASPSVPLPAPADAPSHVERIGQLLATVASRRADALAAGETAATADGTTEPAAAQPAKPTRAPAVPRRTATPTERTQAPAEPVAQRGGDMRGRHLEAVIAQPGCIVAALLELPGGGPLASAGRPAPLERAASMAAGLWSGVPAEGGERPTELTWRTGGLLYVLHVDAAQTQAGVLAVADANFVDEPALRWACSQAAHDLARGNEPQRRTVSRRRSRRR